MAEPITISVRGRSIAAVEPYEPPSAGDVATCRVSFDVGGEGWEDLARKYVTFYGCAASVGPIDFEGEMDVPWEVMREPGEFRITLTGCDADGSEVMRTHEMAYGVRVDPPGKDEGEPPSEPTKTAIARIDALAERLEASEDGRDEAFQEAQGNRAASFAGSMSRWGSMVDGAAQEASQAAADLREAAERGDFDGEDGFSPTATVEKAGKVATITITDKDGTTTATVSDGEPGLDADIEGANAAIAAANSAADAAIAKAQQAGVLISSSDAEEINGKLNRSFTLVESDNILDPSKFVLGKYVSKDGTEINNQTYGYIRFDCVPGDYFASNGAYMRFVAAYDADGVAVPSLGAENAKRYDVPNGIYSIVVSVNKSNLGASDVVLVKNGRVYTPCAFFPAYYDYERFDLRESLEFDIQSGKIEGKRITNTGYGPVVSTAGWELSRPIPVNPGSTIRFYFEKAEQYANEITFCSSARIDTTVDIVEGVISTDQSKAGKWVEYQVPANATHMFLCLKGNGNIVTRAAISATAVMADGSVSRVKLADGAVSTDKLADYSVTSRKLAEGAVVAGSLEFMTVLNVFDGETEPGYLSNGNIARNDSYATTMFIKANAGDTLYSNVDMRFINCFDADMNFITGSVMQNLREAVMVPGTEYVRATLYASETSKANLAFTPLDGTYHPYGYARLNKDFVEIPGSAGVEPLVIMPKEICVAVGRTVEVYDSQVCLNADKFHVQWSCDIGAQYRRKLQIIGTDANVGTYTASFKLIRDDGSIAYTGQTTVKVVADNMPSSIAVCPIGDSLTNKKAWLADVKNLHPGFQWVGTRWSASSKAQSTYGHEGRSGATAAWYLTNGTYTFDTYGDTSANPFWNPSAGKFDWSYYKATYGINPNAVQVFLGTNGLSEDNTQNAANILAIVRGIRQSDANIPIYIVNTLYGGNQNGIAAQQKSGNTDGYAGGWKGINEYVQKRKIYDLITRLYAGVDAMNDANVHFVPVAFTHDSEYNFGAVETPVNPYATQTELVPTEATHPQAAGYHQMADIMYSTFCAYQM